LKTILELEKIAIDVHEVCIMDTVILKEVTRNLSQDIREYFSSKRARSLREPDLFFEWLESPSV